MHFARSSRTEPTTFCGSGGGGGGGSPRKQRAHTRSHLHTSSVRLWVLKTDWYSTGVRRAAMAATSLTTCTFYHPPTPPTTPPHWRRRQQQLQQQLKWNAVPYATQFTRRGKSFQLAHKLARTHTLHSNLLRKIELMCSHLSKSWSACVHACVPVIRLSHFSPVIYAQYACM